MRAVLRPGLTYFRDLLHLSPISARTWPAIGTLPGNQANDRWDPARPRLPPSRLNGAYGRSIPYDRLKSVDEIFDVAVVGAGPAGSVAAYAAATRGLRVALIDRQAFPRDKPCGDGIGPGAVHIAQELGLDDIFSGDKPVHTLRVTGPDGSGFHSSIPSIAGMAIQGYVVPRIHFDKRLFDRAIGVGAHDYSGMKFVGTEISDGLRMAGWGDTVLGSARSGHAGTEGGPSALPSVLRAGHVACVWAKGPLRWGCRRER